MRRARWYLSYEETIRGETKYSNAVSKEVVLELAGENKKEALKEAKALWEAKVKTRGNIHSPKLVMYLNI